MNDKRINLLQNEKISKAINSLAIPAIIGMLVMAIYNVADSIFVSWIGDYEIAAVQVVLPIMLIASAIGLSLGIGGGSYISRLLGMNDKDKASIVSSVSFISGLIIGVIVIAFSLIFLNPILELFGSDENTHALAVEYGKYVTYGFGFTILNMILNNMLRSEGSSMFSMIGMTVGALLNIILDPIFIFVFDMGISGAAIATTVSQMISTAILLSMYVRKKAILSISISLFKPSIAIYKELLIIGLPTFARQLLVSVSMGLLNNIATEYGGTELLSAISVVMRVILIPSYIIFGFGQGFQPVAGYNFGAKNKERVIESFKYSIIATSIVSVTFFILFNIFSDLIFDIFRSSDTVRSYGVVAMRYYTFGLLFLGVSNTIGVFYQSLGKGLEALLLSVARQGLFLIPLILILPLFIDIDGVLMAQAIGDMLTGILSIIVVIPFIKQDKIHYLMEKKVINNA